MTVGLPLVRPVVRLYRKLRLNLLGKEKSWRKVATGFWMYIDPEDSSDVSIFFGTYERALVRAIYALVRRGEICVDVGAEKGYITLHLACAVGNSGRVLSFEPDFRAVHELSENCAKNGVSSIVKILTYALADKEGVCRFALSKRIGFSSRFPNETARPLISSFLSIPTKTLDQVLKEERIHPRHDTLSFIKIDAEGSEPLIIAGMSKTLEQFRPAVWVEVNRGSLRTAGFSEETIEGQLRSAGYELFRPREFRGVFFRLEFYLDIVHDLKKEPGELMSILAIPKDSAWKDRVDRLFANGFLKRESAVLDEFL